MWPFKRKTQTEPRDERLSRLEESVGQLEELAETLDKIRLEWADYEHKFSALHARLVKRAKAEDTAPGPPAPEPYNPAALRLLGINMNGG